MRRCTVLLLLAAAVAVPSVAFAHVQTTDFRAIMSKCDDKFQDYDVYMYGPDTADFTISGGVGINDCEEFGFIALILANPSAPHHDAIHAAFKKNTLEVRKVLGSTIVNMTVPTSSDPWPKQAYFEPQPNIAWAGDKCQWYGVDALFGCYMTMNEWALYDDTMCGIKNSLLGGGVTWPKNFKNDKNVMEAKAGLQDDLLANYDVSTAEFLMMCGDLDNDTASNCQEYWAQSPFSYAKAIDNTVSTKAMYWGAWACLDENHSSVRFAYDEGTDKVYIATPTEITWEEARAYTVQWPGGSSVPVKLAEIRSEAENTRVKNLANYNTAWIGMTDKGNDIGHTAPNPDDWHWLTTPTEPMVYRNWNTHDAPSPNEPNGIDGGEDYGEIRDDGKWNDTSGGENIAIYESTVAYPDEDNNHQPDAFEDKDHDLVPDGLGVARAKAGFTMSPNPASGNMPLAVTFTSTSTQPSGQTITGYAWNFGDGATSTAQNPSHTFMATAPFSDYTVSLTITATDGGAPYTDTYRGTVHVVYVCVFEGKLTDEGADVAEICLGADPLGVKADLLAQSPAQNAWSKFDWENLQNGAGAGDGLPDEAQMALIQAVACGGNDDVYNGMATNKAAFLADIAALDDAHPDLASLNLYADYFAGMIGSSSAMKATINAIFAEATGTAGLPSLSTYVVFSSSKAGEMFAADGDYDGDGDTNVDEYTAVINYGGGIDMFVDVALDPWNLWPGNPDLPVAGILGLGLLAGSLLAGASLSLRKKH